MRALALCAATLVLASTGCTIRPGNVASVPASTLRRARIIYIGEKHDQPSHHQLQEEIIRWLHREEGSFAIGMEMLEVTQQADLNDYLQKRIPWNEFARRTGFERGWGRTSSAYRRIISWCRRNAVPIIALNAPQIVAQKLALGEPLSAEEKRFLPKHPEPPGGFERFQKVMSSAHHTAAPSLGRYYKAQRAWDETMAQRILAWLAEHSGTLLVILGRFHADPRTGVPWYVARRSSVRQLILFPTQEKQSSGD
jgi:uncharacterized iron-regulated protein